LLLLHRFDALENITESETFLHDKTNGATHFTDVSMQISEFTSQKQMKLIIILIETNTDAYRQVGIISNFAILKFVCGVTQKK